MDRLKEPSTWAGVAGFGTVVSQVMPQWGWLGTLIAGIGSAVAMALRERGGV